MAALKVAILISGRGSNMEALVRATAAPDFPADVVLVVANNPGAAGLATAAAAGIETAVIDHRDFPDRRAFEDALDRNLTNSQVDLICLAGFMRLLTPEFVRAWPDRIVNIHPSLLPAFKGLDVHERVLREGARFTGCTVHFVRAEMDAGPIIAQAAIPVRADDTPAALAARVLAAEHRCYPMALRLIAEGRVSIEDGTRVRIADSRQPDQTLFNPVDS